MHRISVSLSDEAHEALRHLAFREGLQPAVCARTLLYGALALSTGRAEENGLPQSKEEPRSRSMTAPRTTEAADAIRPWKGADFKR